MPEKASVKIYQNYITDSDLTELDSSFIPHDWRHNPFPEYREIGIFLDFFDKGQYKEADYVGIMSKKFSQKTKMSGANFIKFIKANPGFDVYFINPFPQNIYFSFNVWDHGENIHPGIIEAAQKLFDFVKAPIQVDKLGRNNNATLLYCNYWVGNHYFWETYMAWIKLLFQAVTEQMPPDMRKLYFNNTNHDGGVCVLFPFLFERLFSTFLLMQPNIKYLGYKYTHPEILKNCVNKHEVNLCKAFSNLIDRIEERDHDNQNLREIIKAISSFMQSDSLQKT